MSERAPLQNQLSQARGGRVQDRRSKPRNVVATVWDFGQGNRRQMIQHNRRSRDAARYPVPEDMDLDEL